MDKAIKERIKMLSRGIKYGGGIYSEVPEKKKKKEKEDKISNRGLYDITLNNFQFHLYTAICMINGIDNDVYIYADRNVTVLNANLKIDKVFKQLSKLDWEHPSGIDTLTFRGRFATCLLLKIIHNSHKIVKGLYNSVNTKDGKHRWKSYNALLNELIYHINTFITAYLSLDIDYVDHLTKIYEIILISEGKEIEIVDRMNAIREMIASNLRSPSYDDGTICNNVMKLAYVLSTDSLKLKDTPKYDEYLEFRDYARMGNQIGTLGYAIMKRRMKTGVVPFMYKTMNKAMPELITRFVEADEMPELVIGTKAITLLEIFMGDPRIIEYIDRVVK